MHHAALLAFATSNNGQQIRLKQVLERSCASIPGRKWRTAQPRPCL